MKEHVVNGNVVEYFDSIDDLPIVRHHRFNEFIALSSGIGSTMEDIDHHITGLAQMINRGDKELAINKLMNMRQGIQFAIENVNPKSMAFAVLVNKINGQPMNDITDFGLKNCIVKLHDVRITYGMIKTVVDFVKKKLRKKPKFTFLN